MMENLDTLSCRLNYALELTGTRKADLARAIDVKPQVIQFLCNSKTKASRFSFEIATALGLSVRWLATGEGAMFLADT
ncbi:MAG: helix-turn-helix transcriptional regulator, partial [Coxiellaceae bacterium]|nr:helix-turn-helix transcriptional regulator [Coxiellaceae bacterium]